MQKYKLNHIQQAEREKYKTQCQACEAAIQERLAQGPANIYDLDALGFSIQIVNAAIRDMRKRGQIITEGYTYRKKEETTDGVSTGCPEI